MKRTVINSGIVEVGGLAVRVIRKKIQCLRLVVHPPAGRITLSVPLSARREEIFTFLNAKLPWIREKIALIAQRPQPVSILYADGEIHYIWGRPCILHLEESAGRPSVVFSERSILLRVPPGCDLVLRGKILHGGFGGLLMEAVRPLAEQARSWLNIRTARFFPRRMKSRWGSCSPHSGRIRLNTELVRHPPHLLEYVLVHELVHLLEPGHGQRFYSLLDKALPDWRAARAELRALSPGGGRLPSEDGNTSP
jgi:predicted metal-dependent hydrolase